jgi:predicted amidophosphoribosyltransferase
VSRTGAPTWPPKPPDVHPAPAPLKTSPKRTTREFVRAIEHTWLGVTREPFHVRAAEAGWSPDAREDYCARCGGSVGPGEGDGDGCAACRRRRLRWEHAIRLGAYEGVLAEAVREVKFSAWRALGDELGRLLGERIGEELERVDVRAHEAVLVPIPMSWTSRMKRGIDHTLVLARAASRETNVPVVRALRRRHGPTQLDVPPSRRAENVRGVFRCRAIGGSPRVIVLLDDVRTTGATLTSAARALRSGADPGARIWAATAAVTPHRDRREKGT